MRIHEYIKKIVNESAEEVMKAQLFEAVRPIVAESVMEASKNGGKIKVDDLVDKLMKNKEFKKKALKYLTDHDAMQSLSDNLDGKTYNRMDNVSKGSMRRDVTERLKDEKLNWAPIAYKLWPGMTEDAARSWFSKKVHGKGGESFSDEEISIIYHELNNKAG